MSKNKKKVRKLTDAQYVAYIANLRDDPASYNADGSRLVPNEVCPRDTENEQGE